MILVQISSLTIIHNLIKDMVVSVSVFNFLSFSLDTTPNKNHMQGSCFKCRTVY